MMKTLKKALSVFLAVALLACLCIGMGMTGYAAGETITADAVGTYNQSDAEQDVTIRISINGLSEPYCGFYIDDGVELPTGWTLKSYSTSNTAQPVGTTDVNSTKGSLNYATDDLSNSIPADTYYDAVITVPADVSGDFSIVFKNVIYAKDYGSVELASAATVTASVTIKGTDPDPTPTPEPAEGYTVTAAADKTDATVGDTVKITLDVTNSEKTTFNAFRGKLAYNSTYFTYSASDSTLGGFDVTDASGTLTISRYGSNITIPGDSAELTLAFTAAEAGTGSFTLSEVYVSEADSANTDAAQATVSGAPSVTVTAAPQTYTVTFAGGVGATGDAPVLDGGNTVTAGTTITLPNNTFTKEGYTFSKWSDGQNEYAEGAEYTITGNVTFTAQWSKNYTVTFVGGDGATGTAPALEGGNTVAGGTKITLPNNTFTKEGYTFSKWSDGQNEYAEGAEYTITGDVTFTAQWTKTATATASIVSGYLDGYTLIKVTVNGDTEQTPTYDNKTMFKLSGSAYDKDAYYYIVKGNVDASTAQGKLGWSDSAATTLTKDGDANQTGLIDINDAQFIYNLYGSSVSYEYVPTAAQLLASDVNGDGSVDTLDCAAAIAAIK